jgi:hypothetical protein
MMSKTLLSFAALIALCATQLPAAELHGDMKLTGSVDASGVTNKATFLGQLNPASAASIGWGNATVTMAGLGATPLNASSISSGTLAWSFLTGKPTTLSGYGITDAQPLNATLTTLSGKSTTGSGSLVLSASPTITGTLAGSTITASTLSSAMLTNSTSATFSGTVQLVAGSAPGSPLEGFLYWDSTAHRLYGRSNSAWLKLETAADVGADFLSPTGSGAGLTGITTATVTGARFQSTPTQTYTLIVEGDSIPAGHGATHPWSYYLAAMPFFSGHTVRNVCQDSERIPTGSNSGNNLEDHYPSDAYPHRPAASGGDGGDLAIDVIGIGDNDIREGTSSADVISQLQSAVTRRRGDGFRVVLCTLWARGDPVNWDSGNEATRLSVNAAIRSGQITADQIFDVAAQFGDTSDTTFFQSDHSHPTDTGHKRIADLLHSIFLAGGGFRPGIAVGKFEQDIKVNGGVTASGAANITGAVAGGSDGMFADRLGAANGLRVGGSYNGTWTGLVDLGMATVIHPAAGGYGLVLGDAGDPLSINGYGAAVVKIGSLSAHQIMLAGYSGGVVMMGGGSFPTTTGEQCQVNGTTRLGTAGVTLTRLRHGTATLASGTVTVSDANVTTSTRFSLTEHNSGTPNALAISAVSAGASFTIKSSSGSDTSAVDWIEIEP